jgi:hypothetical protein
MCSDMRLRPQTQFDSAMTLMEAGRGDSEIAAMTGVPRATISGWRHGRGLRYHRRAAASNSDWRPRDPAAYCYILGVYLGDGWLNSRSGAWASLIISLDSRHPRVIAEIGDALGLIFPDTLVRRWAAGENCTVIRRSHPALPFAFPQHGPGRKHTRRIRLVPWQDQLTRANPQRLLRGLIHSDGLSVRQSLSDEAAQRTESGVRVSPLLLLESLRRHQADLLRSLRPARDQMDPIQPPEHLGLRPKERRAARRLHRSQDLTALTRLPHGRSTARGTAR